MSKVLVIGDLHFPFHCPKSFKKMMDMVKDINPTHVVQIGDLLDQYVFSKYARTMSVTTAEDVEYGLELATKFWADVKKKAPKAKCHQLIGNHDVRMSKRILEKLPELVDFFSYKDLYKFEGVKVSESDRDYLKIDGVMYVHGWLSKSIDHAKFFNLPTVHGHRHRPCIEFERADLWSMDVGFVADDKSLPLNYTASKFSKWTKAFGIVEDGKPRLVLL